MKKILDGFNKDTISTIIDYMSPEKEEPSFEWIKTCNVDA